MHRDAIKAMVRSAIVSHETENEFRTPHQETLVGNITEGILDLLNDETSAQFARAMQAVDKALEIGGAGEPDTPLTALDT